MESRNFNKVRMMRKPNADSGQQLKKLQKQIEIKYNTKFNDYWEFHKWTFENVAEFWEEMWHFSGVICSKPFDKVVDMRVPFEDGPEWFPGARLNYAENLLKYRDDSVALILAGEDREIEKLTYSHLYQEAELYAAAFRKHGLQKGDIVACYMSNRKEAVIAMLGTVSIGAIWSGVLPLLGAQAALNRLCELQPTFLITVDRFRSQGEEVDMLQKVKKIAEGISSLKKVIIVSTKEDSEKLINEIKNSCLLKDFLSSVDGTVPRMQFEQVPFNYPVYINFTSGTSGKPKGVLHGSAVLLSITRNLLIHLDSNRSSIWFSISPVGWGSWSSFSTALFLGSSVMLYEGQPFYLTPTYFWDLVTHNKVTHAFLPTSVLEEFERRNYVPSSKEDLASLKLIFSGGSCVKESTFDFVYNKIVNNFTFASYYGCTEVIRSCTAFESTVPVYRGEVNVPALGHNVQVLNEKGQAVEGEIGELVLSNISPNILLGYWGDDQRALIF